MKDIVINGNGVKVKRLIELENALGDSQKRLSAVETTLSIYSGSSLNRVIF